MWLGLQKVSSLERCSLFRASCIERFPTVHIILSLFHRVLHTQVGGREYTQVCVVSCGLCDSDVHVCNV